MSEKVLRKYFENLSVNQLVIRAKEYAERIEHQNKLLLVALSVLDERGVL